MACPPRLYLPDVPQYIVQGASNHEQCFFQPVDYHHYLALLRKTAYRYACAVHAYVLLNDHVQLLLTPSRPDGVSGMMQTLSSSYARYVNSGYERTGTLWAGRFKACLVESDRFLLACYRYIELNPVRAGMVVDPAHYRWSSYQANACGEADPVVQPHPLYLRLGMTEGARLAAYRRLAARPLADEVVTDIRAGGAMQQALGSVAFRDRAASAAEYRRRRRPAQRVADNGVIGD